jgi:hypothetical protein
VGRVRGFGCLRAPPVAAVIEEIGWDQTDWVDIVTWLNYAYLMHVQLTCISNLSGANDDRDGRPCCWICLPSLYDG